MKLISIMRKILPYGLMFLLIALFILDPAVCKTGVSGGIILSSRVIIPSLYPFTVCVLFLMRSGLTEKSAFLSPVTRRLFGLDAYSFLIMLFSFVGGYPVGAKLINAAVEDGRLSPDDGGNMLCYCVNAGPAFIMAAVGSGMLGSGQIGAILLASHVLSSLILCFLLKLAGKNPKTTGAGKSVRLSVADNFVSSAADAASATLGICAFIIFFSAVNAYMGAYSDVLPVLRPLSFLTEVTSAVSRTRNIYLISFLLGFAGVCIWGQVLTVAKRVRINLPLFLLFRIFHGLLGFCITAVLIRLLHPEYPVFAAATGGSSGIRVTGTGTGISLMILGLMLLISLNRRDNRVSLLEEFI